METKFYNKDGILEKIVVSNNEIREILYFYSTGEVFCRKLTDEKLEEEYIEYFSKAGETITKLKNNFNCGYKMIYDINSKKYLKQKAGKLYYNGRIYFGRVKYYSDIFLIEESYNREGKLHGITKITHYDSKTFSEIFWKNGLVVIKN